MQSAQRDVARMRPVLRLSRYSRKVQAQNTVKAVGYLRVSGLSQADGERDGLPRQKRAIESYAESHALEIVRWYQDEGVSGTKDLEDRPALFQLRQDLVENGVRIVVIENMSRLARDLMVSETILADFQKNGIEIISTTEPDLCSQEPSRIFIRQVLAAMAGYERAVLVSRMRAGKVRSGKYGGRKAYASKPEFKAVVNRIWFLRRQGFNLQKITDVLNLEGYKTICGGKWFPSQISRVLRKKALV